MKNRLALKEKAPCFEPEDIQGQKITVSNQSKWLFLSFHRFAACSFCNLRTNELIRNNEKFKDENIEIVSIWPSDRDKLLQYAGKEKSPLLILSNHQKIIYRKYGVTKSSKLGMPGLLIHPRQLLIRLKNKPKISEIDADPNLMPASFLVDPNGIIRMAYYGKYFGDHLSIDSIFEVVRCHEK